ncbi:MAG: serine/threonine protein kinase [Kiritimatiellae bacterium]|nr:serine/threonine protein kinase [Kiritimatiellia bacterium]
MFVDQFDNQHFLSDEVARGGQGAVYRTQDADLAIKMVFGYEEDPKALERIRNKFMHIRQLPIPKGTPISLPLAILKDAPGYVMRLLNGMVPLAKLQMSGQDKIKLADEEMPQWLKGCADDPKTNDFAYELWHYSKTGSTSWRFYSLYKTASVLAQLHQSGLVYGDVSLNNVFIGYRESNRAPVWLIDADNLRYEMEHGGSTVYTPKLGAPEIVQTDADGHSLDASRPRTDCWAFAVMAFQLLSTMHPFIGRRVLEQEDDSGWDSDEGSKDESAQIDEQAYAGKLPYIDDPDDDSNSGETILGLPRQIIFNDEVRSLFNETFGPGRTDPWRRPSMIYFAKAFARAHDTMVWCPKCGMSYYIESMDKCPYCDATAPLIAKVIGPYGYRYEVASESDEPVSIVLPRRLFEPFSLASSDEEFAKIAINWNKKRIEPVRGESLPYNLKVDFLGGEK